MTIAKKYASSQACGFTLAELLVVIGIVALAAAISLPFYRSITMNLDLTAAGRDLASDLRYAQQLSVTTQINQQAVFDIAGNSYLIRNTLTGATIKSRTIKPPITILSVSGLPGNAVTFNATGAVDSAGAVVLINPNNRTSTIEIKPSGYVKVQ